MHPVDIQQAKTTLSRLVQAIEQGQEQEIVIARNGQPAAKLVPVDTVAVGRRIGVAQDQFEVPDSIDTQNAEVARLFTGGTPA